MKAVAHPHARPDLHRPGTGLVMASTWSVGTPERQRAAVDAIGRAWRTRDWPDVGLLSYSVFVGDDGDTLMHYSQWTGEAEYQDYFRRLRDDRNDEIDAAVPGIVRVELRRYEPPRTVVLSEESADSVPGAVVVVETHFDTQDPGPRRDWIDRATAALAGDRRKARGGIAAHFHLSTDSPRVLNHTEWERAQDHAEWVAQEGEPAASWEELSAFPGLTGSRILRYAPALSLSAGA
ncbi:MULTISPECIES: antibiotic biosynthesis monooxygenase [Streptomyces]|uniref:Antibiotic biosynthesis monooxygenase n=1 Tax=Streptomyces solicathayae TaxID=3081768 RepID=A0ABZ0M011_9ACTN|nr:antibiotic biosynthesis monooxygenase [Streptomyces sp. HUAS YS2]WOX25104.1 antibiotic biosynthesis monooxygenase [Streptomyces sp. HUAS YS2]